MSEILSMETDTHTHTVASTHAYSTVEEMARGAARKGLKAIAITDHGPALPDGAHEWHFSNMRCLPPVIEGVRVLHGAEANIVDFDGGLDLPESRLRELDWVIASFHAPVRAPGTPEEHTRAYLSLAQNPLVDVIGHSGGDDYRYDYEKVLPVFKKNRKLVEINSHSFEARRGSKENCHRIAIICRDLKIPVVVDSDAHSSWSVGDQHEALEMLREIDFPPELIVNARLATLADWIYQSRKRHIL